MEQSVMVSSSSNEIQPPRAGAGFWVRVGARIIDTIIHNVVWYVSALLTGFAIGIVALIAGISTSQLSAKLGSTSIPDFVFALVGYILYHAICEYLHGASMGKLIFRIHVKSESGRPISIQAALVRSFAYVIDSLFFGIVAYESMKKSALNQRLGDNWAKTVVVERSALPGSQIPSGWMFVLAFILAILADGLVACATIVLKLV